MVSAIRDPDPVIFIEHKRLYMNECEVPEEQYAIPFGEATIVREGKDVTIVGILKDDAHFTWKRRTRLLGMGVEAEVIYLRTYSPHWTSAQSSTQ